MTLARTLLTGAAAASVIASVTATAQAADLVSYRPSSPTSFYSDPVGFAFEGFYAGVQGGAVLAGGIAGTAGGFAGVNFALGDTFYIGGEAQASAWFTGGGLAGYDVLGLARLGVLLTDNAVVYAAAGGGLVNGTTPVYALGGGVEFGVTDSIGLRAEGLALGGWGAAPFGGKVQAGLVFHIN